MGFHRSLSSEYLFIGDIPSGKAYLVIYVDGILIFGNTRTMKDDKKTFAGFFKISDLGECKYFLGIKIEKTDQDLCLSKGAYTTRVIKAAGLENSKPEKTSLPLGQQLYEAARLLTDEEITTLQDEPYRDGPSSTFLPGLG